MKKILVLILATVFVFLLSTNILANTPNSDLIYTVTEDPAYLTASVYGTSTNIYSFAGAISYRKNRETFASISFAQSSVSLAGSYLSDSGLFLGASGHLDKYNINASIAPGYRLDFNESSYIAGRVIWWNYFNNNYSSFLEYDVYGKYFDNKTKIEGQFDYINNNIAVSGDINRKIADGVVIGSNFSLSRNYYYSYNYVIDLDGGISLNNDFLAANIRLLLESPISNSFQITPSINANGILYFGNLGLGANYSVSTNFEQLFQGYSLKGKLRFSDSSLLFVFQPSIKSWVLSLEKR